MEAVDFGLALVVDGFEIGEVFPADGLSAEGVLDLGFEVVDFAGEQGFFAFEAFDVLVDLFELASGFDFFGVGFVDGGAHFLEVFFEVRGLVGELLEVVLEFADALESFGDGVVELSQLALAGDEACRARGGSEVQGAVGVEDGAVKTDPAVACGRDGGQSEGGVDGVDEDGFSEEVPGESLAVFGEGDEVDEFGLYFGVG